MSAAASAKAKRHTQNAYMGALQKKLMELRGNSESTAKDTVSAMYRLNDGPFESVTFLYDTEKIIAKIDEHYATDASKLTVLGKIVAVLDTIGSPRYNRIRKIYKDTFDERRTGIKKAAATEEDAATTSTEADSADYMPMSEILERQMKLTLQCQELFRKPLLTVPEYNKLQQLLVLSLFTLIPARRNQDFQFMVLVKNKPEPMNKDRNYYVLSEKRMYFNKFKTAKSKLHQDSEVDVPVRLQNIIWQFIKHTAIYKASAGKAAEMPLICSYHGPMLENNNAITRILNQALERNVGSRAIRHAYVTSLYDPAVIHMAENAKAMAHSISTHIGYYKADKKKLEEPKEKEAAVEEGFITIEL